MEIEEVIEKVRNLRTEHNREIQQEIIEDLKKFREILLDDINNLPNEIEPAQNKESSKLEYRIGHLKKNYLELLEKSEKEKEEWKKEKEKLLYRISIMKQNLKSQ